MDQVKERPAEAEELNARGTLNVLEAALASGVDRVLYASTIWVYGGSAAGDTVDEETLLGAPGAPPGGPAMTAGVAALAGSTPVVDLLLAGGRLGPGDQGHHERSRGG